MEAWRGLSCFTLLCVLLHVREPTKKPSSGIYPNPRPPNQPQPGNPNNGGNIYPRTKPLPPRPQPGNSGGFLSDSDLIDGGRYHPRPPAGGGGGGFQPGHDGYGRGGRNIPGLPGINYGGGGGGFQPGHDGYGQGGRNRLRFPGINYGGAGHSTAGNQQGNMIAKIVSPIVSMVVVTLIGLAVRYYNQRRNSLRTNEPRTI
ncbi:glycoprotein Xg isoform X3 [Bos javanicus]|uniref:glycoprotein Xg isoform X3 n=1 Tax=Bos javanicus TaxID=9906 RepID=UPI002AA6BA86|nr:glycoprotein Xg isoform X3 [Bos javanicus]